LAEAKITSKGQITIPVKVRVALGVEAGDRLEFVRQENGQFVIVPATRSVRELKGMLRVRRSKPVSIEEMDKVIAQRASESR
jgi:AbrB family looped-hinge helix DNA binding protein